MNLIYVINSFGVGIMIGYLIPQLSEEIIRYKYENMQNENKDILCNGYVLKGMMSIFNGAAWTAAGLSMANHPAAFILSVLITLALIITVIDIRVRRIPNELLLIALTAGGSFQLVYYGLKPFLMSLACMVAMMILFILVGLTTGMDKVGAGDVKLAGVMGMVLGFPGILVAALVMSLSFSLYSIGGILFRRMTLYSMLPFAPFMMLGLIASLSWILWVG